MFRVITASSLVWVASAAGRTASDFGGACVSAPDQVWETQTRRGDGAVDLVLPSTAVCYGTTVTGGVFGTDPCDGMSTQLWSPPQSAGPLHNLGTTECLAASSNGPPTQQSCGASAPLTPLTKSTASYASASSAAVNRTAWLAFDGNTAYYNGSLSWRSAGVSYGADGWPLAGAPTTVVNGAPVVGHWVQRATGVAVPLTAYSLVYDGEPAPRRRPRDHVLVGAPTAAGPWYTVGAAQDSTSLVAPESRFSVAGGNAFLAYRLIVTRVQRMGDGSTQLGELSLLSNAQRFDLVPSSNAVGVEAPWRISTVDAWAGLMVPATLSRANGSLPNAWQNTTLSSVARYNDVIALSKAGQKSATSLAALTAGGLVTVGSVAGSNAAVVSASFLATTAFSQTVTVAADLPAALFVYDLTTSDIMVVNSGESATFSAAEGRAYDMELVMEGLGTAATTNILSGHMAPGWLQSTTLSLAPPIFPSTSAAASPIAAGRACGSAYFSLF